MQAALDAKDVPANVLSNCKRLRDQRHGPELVRDEVEIQLEIEVKIIEESRKSLNDHLLNISRQLWYGPPLCTVFSHLHCLKLLKIGPLDL